MEASNVQKMQRVITDLYDILDTWSDRLPSCLQDKVNSALEEADAALALPLRQCDVGTPEEQNRRFDNFCRGKDCSTCPCNVMPRCHMVWAQTPYTEEGGAE